MKWSKEKANRWYEEQPWLVGCNFLPSSAINQLEMFQEDTFDEKIIERELDWAKDLGFNSLRVYLHDLLWSEKDKFKKTFDRFLDICEKRNIKPIIVLFDDCHRPFPIQKHCVSINVFQALFRSLIYHSLCFIFIMVLIVPDELALP